MRLLFGNAVAVAVAVARVSAGSQLGSASLEIVNNNSFVSMGTTGDVKLVREGDGLLGIDNDVAVTGDLAVAKNAYFEAEVQFSTSSDGSQTLESLYDKLQELLAASAAQQSASDEPGTLDHALKEALCSRQNCCNEEHEWLDSNTARCWNSDFDDYESDPCGCIVKFTELTGSWKDHDKYCQITHGGQLFSLHSDTAADFVLDFSTSSVSIYVGLHDYQVEDNWQNSDGTPATWVQWNTGEPNDSSGEDCAEIYTSTAVMNDVDCSTSYSSRYASACTILKATEKMPEATIDKVTKEAMCSRNNCCNEAYSWANATTLHCWRNQYDFFEEDPCSCIVSFYEALDSWSGHNTHCVESGGQMFSVHSDNAADAIAEVDTDSSVVYLGLHDYHEEDFWAHTDGTPFNWAGWSTGEPNDSNGEDCAELVLSSTQMNDIPCDTSYSNRYMSACTYMDAVRDTRDTLDDRAYKEAHCSRMNCCNEAYKWSTDGNSLYCWNNIYDSFDADPCSCTVKIINLAGSWNDHDETCMAMGGQMMSVHSGNSASALQEYGDLTDSVSVFIGLHDYYSEDEWMWSDGTPVNWISWNSGEPNDSNGEDCGELLYSSAMNDIPCANTYSNRFTSACLFMNQ